MTEPLIPGPHRPHCRQCQRPLPIWYDHYQGGFKKRVGYGYQGNGQFCTIRCGYHWAIGVRAETVRRAGGEPR